VRAQGSSCLTVTEVTEKTSKKFGVDSVKTLVTRERGMRDIRPQRVRESNFPTDSIRHLNCDQQRSGSKRLRVRGGAWSALVVA
jgi:hypothetical protein